jgi:solute carrier family 36 (proton-coupled amino acid transporter)
MGIGISITFFYITQDLPAISSRKMIIFDITKIPLFFGTAIFLFESIGIVLPLQNEMKEPKNFTRPLGVLNMGMLILMLAASSVGLLGYWKYGDDVASSLATNLPSDEWLAQFIKIIVSCGVLLGYAIQFYIPIKILLPKVQNLVKPAERNPLIGEIIFRICVVLVTFVVALLVPNLGLLISMIGAVCSNSLALVFPVIIEYLVVTRDNRKMHILDVVKNILVLSLAIIGLLSGGYESIRGIVSIYQ